MTEVEREEIQREEIQNIFAQRKAFIAECAAKAMSVWIQDSNKDYSPNVERITSMLNHDTQIVDEKSLLNITIQDLDDDLVDTKEAFVVRDMIYDRVIANVINNMRNNK